MATQDRVVAARGGRLPWRGWSLAWRLGAAAGVVAAVAVASWVAAGPGELPQRAQVHLPWRGGLLAFSHDGTALATWVAGRGKVAGRVSLRDAADGRRLADWPVSEPMVILGAFAPDGSTFTFLAWKGDLGPPAVHRVEVATGRALPAFTIEPFSARHSVVTTSSLPPTAPASAPPSATPRASAKS